jgi:hypothetical protein
METPHQEVLMNKPNDRPQVIRQMDTEDDDPKIYLVVNNQKFLRPGLETYYAKPGTQSKTPSNCSCNPVIGTYCTCNKVCTCNPQCSCQGHTTCSCVSRSSKGGTYCSCVPVY